MPPSAWQQGDYLVIVEGPTDERYLAGFLPLEMSRALVLVGGSAGAVVQVSRTLSGKKGLLPWIAIRDRDLSNAEEVKQLTSSDDHLFVWPGRAIENFFLDGRLISATLKRAGIDRLPIVVESELKALADAEREEVTNRLLERRLRESYHGTQPERRNDVYAWYMAEAETANQRATGVQLIRPEVGAELDQRWPVEWKEMVQAKRVLSKYLDRTPFRTLATFTDAAVQACKAEPALTPPPIVDLRERLHEL